MTGINVPPAEHFAGRVLARALRVPDSESSLALYEVTFESSARTHWHTHPKGQALLITAGRALVQLAGQPVTEHDEGDVVWIPPGVCHWHGAAPEGPMTHVAAQEAAACGSTIAWCGAAISRDHIHPDEQEPN